jgi:hypothetical protein
MQQRSIAKTEGVISAKLESHGERLDRAEETLQQHTSDIGK